MGCAGLAIPPAVPLEDWKHRASELRELPFTEAVGFEWVDRERMREIVRDEIVARFSELYVERYRDAYVALGVLPSGIDLLATFLDLHQGELVGLYSLHKHMMYVVQDLDALDPDQSALIVTHELVHALQHQSFPETMELLQGFEHNDDIMTALSAAVEGDASFTMLGASASPAFRRNLETAERVRDMWLRRQDQPGEALVDVPRLLRVSLFFPYAYGTLVAARAFDVSGNAGLNERLRNPPLSTLRVLYPEDEDPVEFIGLPLERLRSRLASRGCELGHHNVAGVVTLRVLFEEHGDVTVIDALLPGWSGDRFVQVYCSGSWELAWFTRWDQLGQARSFAQAYRGIADGVAEGTSLSGPPRVVVRGRSALVFTPGLEAEVEWLLQQTEIRPARDFADWLAQDCFPESPCPHSAGDGSTVSLSSPCTRP